MTAEGTGGWEPEVSVDMGPAASPPGAPTCLIIVDYFCLHLTVKLSLKALTILTKKILSKIWEKKIEKKLEKFP